MKIGFSSIFKMIKARRVRAGKARVARENRLKVQKHRPSRLRKKGHGRNQIQKQQRNGPVIVSRVAS